MSVCKYCFFECMFFYLEMSYGVDFKGFLNYVIWIVKEFFISDNICIVNKNIYFFDIFFYL